MFALCAQHECILRPPGSSPQCQLIHALTLYPVQLFSNSSRILSNITRLHCKRLPNAQSLTHFSDVYIYAILIVGCDPLGAA